MEELKIEIDDTYCHVIKFGNGPKNLLILPGANLCGLEGQGEQIADAYKVFQEDFSCYLIDVRKNIKEGFSLNDIAHDVFVVCRKLNINHAYVYGVSLGGMIGILIEEMYPNYLDRFVVCSSMCKTTNMMKDIANEWKFYASNHDVVNLNKSFFKHCYSKQYLKKFENVMDNLLHKGNNEECDRFAILCDVLSKVDLSDDVYKIGCRTLVIGDTNDDVIGPDGSKEFARLLNADLYMYDKYSHAVYDEAPDVKERVYNFMMGDINDQSWKI